MVANIERGEDDSDLQKDILDVWRRKRSGKVAVALTKADVSSRSENVLVCPNAATRSLRKANVAGWKSTPNIKSS